MAVPSSGGVAIISLNIADGTQLSSNSFPIEVTFSGAGSLLKLESEVLAFTYSDSFGDNLAVVSFADGTIPIVLKALSITTIAPKK